MDGAMHTHLFRASFNTIGSILSSDLSAWAALNDFAFTSHENTLSFLAYYQSAEAQVEHELKESQHPHTPTRSSSSLVTILNYQLH